MKNKIIQYSILGIVALLLTTGAKAQESDSLRTYL